MKLPFVLYIFFLLRVATYFVILKKNLIGLNPHFSFHWMKLDEKIIAFSTSSVMLMNLIVRMHYKYLQIITIQHKTRRGTPTKFFFLKNAFTCCEGRTRAKRSASRKSCDLGDISQQTDPQTESRRHTRICFFIHL